MNPYREVTNFHITYPGHWYLNVPSFTDQRLFFCFEEGTTNGTPHTHVGLSTGAEPVSKSSMLGLLEEAIRDDSNVPEEYRNAQLDIKVHRSFNSIIGYHYGLGEKPKCPEGNIFWPYENFDERKHIMSSRNKKSTNPMAIKARNKLLEDEDSNNLVREGFISIFQKKSLSENKNSLKRSDELKKLLPDVSWVLRSDPLWKQRHLWVTDVSNRGKTELCRMLAEIASVHEYDATDSKFWNGYLGQQFVVFNDFAGTIPVSSLKTWTDGGCTVGIKGGSVKLHSDVVFIITSNRPMMMTYSHHFASHHEDWAPMNNRFLQIDAREFYNILRKRIQKFPKYQWYEI